jgi:hypothetical protein
MPPWLTEDTRARRLALAAAVYLVATAVFLVFAARTTLTQHTPYNHFALLADSWLHGRLDLGGMPPAYTGNNDFAHFGDRWYVVFPAFPAALLLPVAAWAGSPERVRDGQFFILLAGIAPAVLCLALEKMRRSGLCDLSSRGSCLLSLLFAFGTVYFFCAEQGTVWYAAHVVGAGLAALYLLFALGAERPWLAGTVLGLGVLTRTPLLFAAPLFLMESIRVSLDPSTEGPWWSRVDRRRLLGLWGRFLAPIAVAAAVCLWHNHARFGSPLEFGYQYLTVAWQARMQKWGLFHYHYLARNLGVVLTSLPWTSPLQINAHGLALWVTSPFYLWLVWPRRTGSLFWALWLTVAAVALPTLFYQNTGWVQFGYRFSNDYSVFLFALLAVGGTRLRGLFWAAAAAAVVVNAFGAVTFDRDQFRGYYLLERTQRVLYQPD